MRIIASFGGRDWLVESRSPRLLSGLPAGPGLLAAVPDDGKPPPVCGRIVLSPDDVPEGEVREDSVARDGSTVHLRLKGVRADLELGGCPIEAAVACRPGETSRALVTVFRFLGIHEVLRAGGLALHASSVRTGQGLLLFAGRAGSGKSTAAREFAEDARLDEDLVLLYRDGDCWMRLGSSRDVAGGAVSSQDCGGLRVRAVLFPQGGGDFKALALTGARAAGACLNLPHRLVLPMGFEIEPVLERAAGLAKEVPVAEFWWKLGENLPRMLEDFLCELEGKK